MYYENVTNTIKKLTNIYEDNKYFNSQIISNNN